MIANAMGWLVVSREKDQSMMIGHDLRVTVLRVRGERALVVTSRRRATARQPNWAESDPKWLEVGQTLDVDHDVRFQVTDIRAEQVRLGFSLPPTLQLHRQEVYDAIQRENRRASDST